MEKGKSLAATIDKQLNESVGESHTTASLLAAPSAPADDGNGWNDDDFGGDFDVTLDNHPLQEEKKVSDVRPEIPLEGAPEPAGTWAEDEVVDFDDGIPDPPKQLDTIQTHSLLSPVKLSLFSPMLAAATAVMAQSKIEVLHEQEAPEFEPEPELPPAAKLEIENVIDLAHTTANTPELEPDLLPAAKPDIEAAFGPTPEPVPAPEPESIPAATPDIETAIEHSPEPEPEFALAAKPEIETALEPVHEATTAPGAKSEDVISSVLQEALNGIPEAVTKFGIEESPETPAEDFVGWEEDLYDDDDDDDDDCEDEQEQEESAVRVTPKVEEGTSQTLLQDIGELMPLTPATALVNESISHIQKDHQELMTQIQKQNEDNINKLITSHKADVDTMQSKIHALQAELLQREDQLANKAEQMASMSSMHEREKEDLQRAISETKEEAKKRIQSAKARVENLEAKLKAASGAADAAAGQDDLITALREEGGKLARKQADMEKSLRAAKGETRELMVQLEREKEAHVKAQEKVVKIESELKETRAELGSARRGETLATKLESNLASIKEELERKSSANLELNQQVKELKSRVKELQDEVETVTRGALLESKRESSKIKREHGDMLSEMELKLRSIEKEASMREDALRQEVSELRKRWQDAVRRADALSMDVQNSTGPLLRQLESMERQSRSRAAAWTELETKLRTDLEDNIIEVEKVTKERNEFKVNYARLQRTAKERDEELLMAKSLAEESTSKVEKLETKLLELKTESGKREEEYVEVERLANEGISKVRSDMMKTVVESEERYRSQMESLEKDLKQERSKRFQLEEQLQKLLENVGLMAVPLPNAPAPVPSDKPQKKLRASEDQANILASTLAGLGDEDSIEYETDDDQESLGQMNGDSSASGMLSFAAMEELSQRLKASTVELEALRRSLVSSERTRASLLEELSELQQAKEKLPLFEAKVRELTDANREMEKEIQGLQCDIIDTRQLYRSQLNSLLEEKALVQTNPIEHGNEAKPKPEYVAHKEWDRVSGHPIVAEKID